MAAGECLCGAVRFEVDGPVIGAWFCHCSKCRRASGSPFQAGAVCEREAFRWVRGEAELREYRTGSGYRRVFCGTCASPAPLFPEGTEWVWLPPGALEGAAELRPLHHIFVASKAPWFEISDGLPRYPERAPGG